jgi:hypothetical protein
MLFPIVRTGWVYDVGQRERSWDDLQLRAARRFSEHAEHADHAEHAERVARPRNAR